MLGHGGILAFDDRTDMRDVARHLLRFGAHESCGKCFPCRIGLAARARDVRRRRSRSTRDAARGAAGDARGRLACARTAAACRRRSAACSSTSPTSWGSLMQVTVDGVEVEVAARRDRARRRPRRGQLGPDALLRRAPGAVRRLPRLPGRRRGRARRRDPAPARRRAATAWRSTPRTRRRAASRRAVVELVLSELPEPPARAHRARRRSRATLGVGEPRWPGEVHAPRRTTTRHPYLAFRHELCISCGRCVRACDEVQGDLRADRDRPRLRGEHRRRARRGLPRFGLCFVRRVRRHLSHRRDHRALAARARRGRMTHDASASTPTSRRPAATAASAAAWRRTRATARSPRSARRSTGPPTRATPASRAASRTSSRAQRDRLTTPLIREPTASCAPATWDEAIGRIAPSSARIKDRARPRRDRRPRLLAGDERGLLRDAAPDARRDRHEQHRQLLARLPLADLVRDAQVARPLGRDRLRSPTSTTPTRRSSSARTRPRATRSSARGSSRRRCAGMQLVTIDPRRIELADYGVLHLAPRPGTNAAVMLGLAHVVAARRLRRPRVRRRAHRGLRRGRGAARRLRARRSSRRSRGVPAADLEARRAHLRRGRERLLLVGPRRHRAQVRLRGRAADLQRRADDRQDRPPRLGAAAAARAEQRPGLLRHGRAAGHVHGVPLGRRRGRRARASRQRGASRSRARRATRSRRCSTPRSRAT